MQPLPAIVSAAIFGALWLPWLQVAAPFGGSPITIIPWELLDPVFNPPPGSRPASIANFPPILLAYFGAFLVAAFCGVMALFAAAPRGLVLVAGATPFAVIAWVVGSAVLEMDRAGLPAGDLFDGARMLGIDARSVERLLSELGRVLGPGIYLHYGGALALLIVGASMPRKAG